MVDLETMWVLEHAYQGSWYTITGAGGDLSEWTEGYEDMLALEGIGKPREWHSFKGSDMNERYGLTGENAYPDDLTFLAFPLDGLDVSRLATLKVRLRDRWFDDIVMNDLRRERLNRNDGDDDDDGDDW